MPVFPVIAKDLISKTVSLQLNYCYDCTSEQSQSKKRCWFCGGYALNLFIVVLIQVIQDFESLRVIGV